MPIEYYGPPSSRSTKAPMSFDSHARSPYPSSSKASLHRAPSSATTAATHDYPALPLSPPSAMPLDSQRSDLAIENPSPGGPPPGLDGSLYPADERQHGYGNPVFAASGPTMPPPTYVEARASRVNYNGGESQNETSKASHYGGGMAI
jgi:hypothetical protein